MNIKARITARKIVLSYFFERYFLEVAAKNVHLVDEMDKLEKFIEADNNKVDGSGVIDLQQVLTSGYYDDVDEEIGYIRSHVFGKSSDREIDGEYISKVGAHFDTYKEEVEELVDKHVVSFAFKDMDVMDKVIFLLGFVEYKVIGTPKEVLLNEMIELAKRYGDQASPKLINGIAHHFFSQEPSKEDNS